MSRRDVYEILNRKRAEIRIDKEVYLKMDFAKLLAIGSLVKDFKWDLKLQGGLNGSRGSRNQNSC